MVYSLRSRGKRTVAAEDAAAQQPRRKRSSSLAPTKATRGKSSKTAASDVNVCTHINSSKLSILSAKTREAILDPCNWTCSECATTHNVWACLHCPHFACGRLQNCHAETHFKSSNHPLVIDVCNLSVHCYLCEEWVILDNMDQQIESLRDAMKTVQEQHVDESHTRSGRLLRCGSSVEAHEPRALELQRMDRLDTAIRRWKFSKQYKLFDAWRLFVAQQKQFRLDGSGSADGDKDSEEEGVEGDESDSDPIIADDDDGMHGDHGADGSGKDGGNGVASPVQGQRTPASSHKGKPMPLTLPTPPNAPRTPKSSDSVMATPLAGSPPSTRGRRAARPTPLSVSTRRRRSAQLLGMTGLRNLGQTCYLNSVLQALDHISIYRLGLQDLGKRGLLALAQREDDEGGSTSREDEDEDELESMVDSTAANVALGLVGGQMGVLDTLEAASETLQLSFGGAPLGGLTRQTTAECFQSLETPHPGMQSYLRRRRRKAESPSALKKQEEERKKGLVHHLESLFRVMWSGKWSVISPYSLLGLMWEKIPYFRGYKQQDAQELLMVMEDMMFEELKLIRKRMRHLEREPLSVLMLETAFDGHVETTTTCRHCGHSSSSAQRAFELSLNIPPELEEGCGLEQLIDAFMSPGDLDGCIYNCSKCSLQAGTAADQDGKQSTETSTTPPTGAASDSVERDASVKEQEQGRKSSLRSTPRRRRQPETSSNTKGKGSSVPLLQSKEDVVPAPQPILRGALRSNRMSQLPSVLKFHVKRFAWRGQLHCKLSTHVQLPLTLDMSPYCSDACTPPHVFHASDMTYRLAAVIVHEGNSINYGHYMCYCRLNDTEDKWILTNDAIVTVTDATTVLESQAYLAFYVHTSVSSKAHENLSKYPSTPLIPFDSSPMASRTSSRIAPS
eukprot:m.75416 g.75416  ORF g.75416 m.75416 type:complete len:903 (+) comp12451_c0_seq1:388-3096(+)